MTPEQKNKLDEIRDDLVLAYISSSGDDFAGVAMRLGWDAAVEKFKPVLEALEFYASEKTIRHFEVKTFKTEKYIDHGDFARQALDQLYGEQKGETK